MKGWLIVGASVASAALPIEARHWRSPTGHLPEAGRAEVGQWLVYAASPTSEPLTLVCVELPLARA